jgi:tripartite-type tricarboxylate transporter receptor subunit TctC
MALIVAATGPARADDAYPSQLVRIVVPFPAGSTTDTLTRIVADQLSRKWGKSVIVENIAGQNVGAERVFHSAPDGYTLIVSPPSTFAVNQLLYPNLPYDPTKFVPICLLATVANVLDVRKDFPANSVPELIAYAKANPGKVTYASQGIGSTAQLTAAMLEQTAGIKMLHVPYRGALPALNDVIAGHVDLFFDTITTSLPQFNAGKLKILGVGSTKRAAALPDIPTIQETGLPGFRSITWFALGAPPDTPAAIADKINHDTVEILKDPDVNAKLRKLQLEPSAFSRQETAQFFADETKLWGKVIKDAHITIP